MPQLRGIETFLKAVETGSIAAAARHLGITPAAASQNLARLEKALGTRLLIRTTRSLALTDSGELYRARVAPVLAQLDMAESDIAELQGQPQGRLRISCAAAFGRNMLAPLMPKFMAVYPRVTVELVIVDRQIDPQKEDIDISIRYSHALEPGMVVKRIATVPMLFCAAPSYLRARGRPMTPDDFSEHDCLVYRMEVDGRFMPWPYLRDGERIVPDLKPAAVANDVDTLATMAVHGAGITRLSCFIAKPLIAQRRLEPLFMDNPRGKKVPRIEPEPLEFFLCYRDRQHVPAKVRVFADYIAEALRDHPSIRPVSRPGKVR